MYYIRGWLLLCFLNRRLFRGKVYEQYISACENFLTCITIKKNCWVVMLPVPKHVHGGRVVLMQSWTKQRVLTSRGEYRIALKGLFHFFFFFWNLQDQGLLWLVSATRKRAVALGLGNEFRPTLINSEARDCLPAYHIWILCPNWSLVYVGSHSQSASPAVC